MGNAITKESRDIVDSFNLEGLFKSRGTGATEITLIHKIEPGKGAEVRKVLEGIADSELEDTLWASEEIHFLRVFTIDDDSRLVFITNFSGSVSDYLSDFLVHMPDHLDLLWGNCTGYPEKGARDFKAFMEFIVGGYTPVQFYFAAYPEASVKQVWRALDWAEKTMDFQRTLARPTKARERSEATRQRAA